MSRSYEEAHAKRDMDMIRDILVKIEGEQPPFARGRRDMPLTIMATVPMSEEEKHRLCDHLDMLEQGGFIEMAPRTAANLYFIKGLTWHGRDFLETVRDQKIWEETKKGAKGAGGFTVDLRKDLAKGLVKKQIEEYTGIKI